MSAGDDLSFVVPASHPMLAGHFPGRPIVPGAFLLATIAQLATRWLARDAVATPARITGVRVAKFTRPVLPGETCRVSFSPGAGGLRFTLLRGEAPCVTGTLTLDGDG